MDFCINIPWYRSKINLQVQVINHLSVKKPGRSHLKLDKEYRTLRFLFSCFTVGFARGLAASGYAGVLLALLFLGSLHSSAP